MTHLDLGGDEERRDAEQLQELLADVFLRQHEAVKEVLSQVRRLPVEAVHLAHLHTNTVCTRHNAHVQGAVKPRPHLQQPVQQDGPHLGLQAGVSLQVTLVMEVLQVLVQHADPHVVRTGPAAPQEPPTLLTLQHVFWPDVPKPQKLQNQQLPGCSRSARTEHTPEAGDGRGLDKEVPEAVLSEARRVHRLQLFVGGFDEDTRSGSFLRPALLQEEQDLQSPGQSGEDGNN